MRLLIDGEWAVFHVFLSALSRKGNGMKYEEKLEKLDAHIADNPKDYQAVIARLKTRSDAIEWQRKHEVNMRLKRIAEIRRKYDQECTI